MMRKLTGYVLAAGVAAVVAACAPQAGGGAGVPSAAPAAGSSTRTREASGSPRAAHAPAARPAPPAMVSSGPMQIGDLLPDEQIQQVLNRLTFGGRPGDAEQVRAMGIENWIDWQLQPERIDDRVA